MSKAMIIAATIIAVSLSIGGVVFAAEPLQSKDSREFITILKFDVSDDMTYMERPVGRSLLLKIEKVNAAHNAHFGWELSVIRKPEKQDSRNLLYHSLKWHGPYPTQIFAWHQNENYFPSERTLPVYGYPYEIRVYLLNIETKGTGPETEFISGAVEISLRRLTAPVLQ